MDEHHRADSQPDHSHRSSSQASQVQDYLNWLRGQELNGVTFHPTGPRTRVFIPDAAIEHYFDLSADHKRYEIDLLLRAATGGNPYGLALESIASDCPKVFSILVRIGRPQYIHLFVRKDQLRDRALPFGTDVEKYFPLLEHNQTFFKQFEEHQWQFCVEPLTHSLDSRSFRPQTILPIAKIEELEKGEGGTSHVLKIVVHEEFDKLKRPRDYQEANGFVVRSPSGPSNPADSRNKTSSHDQHSYVVKTYHQEDGKRYFDSEHKAFRSLNVPHTFVPGVIGFHRSFEQNNSHNIILRYANCGTLETYYDQVTPPSQRNQIVNVWRRLSILNTALAGIHRRSAHEPSDPQPSIFQGWHQDIKPANILVAGDLKRDPYNVQFFLGDLGLAHFTAVTSTNLVYGKAGVTGQDMPGPRTYAPPEHNLASTEASEYHIEAKQKHDIWGMACLYSEFNTWIVHGKEGLQQYRESRAAQVNDSKLGDVFHDTNGYVLSSLAKHHEELVDCCRGTDHISPRMWREILNQSFAQSRVRPTADQLEWQMTSMLDKISSDVPVQLDSMTAMDSQSPSLPQQLPPGHEYLSPDRNSKVSSRGPPYSTPKEPYTATMTDYHSRTNSTNSRTIVEDSPTASERLRSIPSRSQPAGLGIRQSDDSPVSAFDALKRRPTDIDGVHVDPASQKLFELSRKRSERARTGKDDRSVPQSKQLRSRGDETLSRDNENSAKASAAAALAGNHLATHGEMSGKTEQSQPPLRTRPVLSVGQLRAWADRTRGSKRFVTGSTQDFSLSNEPTENDLLGTMRQRDHIFIVDDSKSMLDYWTQLERLYEDLALVIKKKKLDPDGSQIQFIKSDRSMEQMNTSKMVEVVRRRQSKIEGTTDFAKKIEAVLTEYIHALRTSFNRRPITIYVLTDGVWGPVWETKTGKDYHLETAATAIAKAVNMLDSLQAHERKIGIQFIQFGNHDLGTKRLKFLDQKLKKAKKLKRDICDTEPATGNVWKMMLGSIDPSWDDDSDSSDADDDR